VEDIPGPMEIFTDVSKGHIAFEIQITIYQSTQRNISEDVRLHEYRCQNVRHHPVNVRVLHTCFAINTINSINVQLLSNKLRIRQAEYKYAHISPEGQGSARANSPVACD
jgi:hypothetical protein